MKNRDENFCLGTSAFDKGLVSSLPQLRSIGETMAALDRKPILMTDCEVWGDVIMRRGNLGAASPLFAKVPDYNNELLLLL